MRKVLLNLSFILFTLSLQAQITITSSDLHRVLDDDIYGIVPTNEEILTLPAAGENMVWNYTNLEFDPDSMAVYAMTDSDANSPISGANSVRATNATLLGLPGLEIPLLQYSRLDVNGFVTLGRSSEAVDYSIAAITQGPTDSINFLAKTHDYGDDIDPLFIIPINYGDNESYTYGHDYDLLLSVAGFGLNKAPTEIDFNYVETQETLGWGILKTKEPLTGNVVEVEVLLVKTTRVEVDSFFLYEDLAPAALLNAFNVTQGQTFTTYNYSFFTKGLKRTAFRILVDENGVLTANMSTDLGSITSTDKVANNLIPVTAFPNPAKGDFTVEFAKETADTWAFDLYNSIGQLVHQQAIDGYQNKAVVSPNTKSVGLHYYSLTNEDGVIVGSGKILLD